MAVFTGNDLHAGRVAAYSREEIIRQPRQEALAGFLRLDIGGRYALYDGGYLAF
jgi:hypothetical protein